MKKKITWKRTKCTEVEESVTINFPAMWVDEYGYYCYSEDGTETIEIGLNGVLSNKTGTHSIEHKTYVSGERYQRRKRDITLNEWREALNKVKQYVEKQIIKTT